jgi:NAD(P)-dependent dehydrogenase (short-subunit alcohol dehydrogenase family)
MHILLTGASKGIGFAIAQKFIQDGADELCLSICSRHQAEIISAREQLTVVAEQLGKKLWVEAGQCDVAKEEEVENFVAAAESRFGAVDLLINNAGLGKFAAVEELSFKAFDLVLSTNLRGVFLVTQRVLPKMTERREGTIVTIGSLAGKMVLPEEPPILLRSLLCGDSCNRSSWRFAKIIFA